MFVAEQPGKRNGFTPHGGNAGTHGSSVVVDESKSIPSGDHRTREPKANEGSAKLFPLPVLVHVPVHDTLFATFVSAPDQADCRFLAADPRSQLRVRGRVPLRCERVRPPAHVFPRSRSRSRTRTRHPRRNLRFHARSDRQPISRGPYPVRIFVYVNVYRFAVNVYGLPPTFSPVPVFEPLEWHGRLAHADRETRAGRPCHGNSGAERSHHPLRLNICESQGLPQYRPEVSYLPYSRDPLAFVVMIRSAIYKNFSSPLTAAYSQTGLTRKPSLAYPAAPCTGLCYLICQLSKYGPYPHNCLGMGSIYQNSGKDSNP